MQSIVARFAELLTGGDGLHDERTDVSGRDLVGGVVAVRGAWWGVVIVRCDRALAVELADGLRDSLSIDEIMRRLAVLVARTALRPQDPNATFSAAVVLAADNALWVPSQARLQSRFEMRVDRHLAIVEIHRRRRSGEVETAGDQGE